MNSIPTRLLTVATLVTAALIAAPAVHAGKGYTLASLDGAYAFTFVEIAVTTDVPPATIYCNGYGTIVFYGDGNAEVTDGYRFCPQEDVVPQVAVQDMTYTVDEDGTVYLTEVGATTAAHCQIADKGAMLLCDNTGGPSGNIPDESVLWMATAAKL